MYIFQKNMFYTFHCIYEQNFMHNGQQLKEYKGSYPRLPVPQKRAPEVRGKGMLESWYEPYVLVTRGKAGSAGVTGLVST